MRIYARLLAVLLAAAAPMPVLAQAPTGSDEQLIEAFQQRYAAMNSAMASRDPKAIAALLTPDFTSVDVSGATHTADQMIQQVAALPQDSNKKSDTTVLSVALGQSKATVVQRYHMTTTKVAPDSTQHAIELVTTSTDTWLQANNAWLLQRTVTDQVDYSIDGKLIAHKEHESSRDVASNPLIAAGNARACDRCLEVRDQPHSRRERCEKRSLFARHREQLWRHLRQAGF
jgi:ketosteroid isomerase-like protein